MEGRGSEQSAQLEAHLRLHVLIGCGQTMGRSLLTVASAALDGGATVIQLRDKTASTRLLSEAGLVLRTLTRERGALLLINDRIDVALAVEADGAHIGQNDMPAVLARRLLGPGRILGMSAATPEEARAAALAGADYLGVGPIFATASKVDAGPATGSSLLTAVAQHVSLPLVAIGGLNSDNAAAIIQAGASGVAVISAVVDVEDVTAAARRLRSAVETALRTRPV